MAAVSTEAIQRQRERARQRTQERRATPEYRDWLLRSREYRRALKAKYRRQSGAKTVAELKADREAKDAAKRAAQPHDEHVREFKRDEARYRRWRTQHDPAYRLNQRMRVQVRKALRGMKRGRSWEAFVGYTLDDLVRHLSRMLPKGASLEGCLAEGWHIDHIVAKSTFDCTDPAELRAAWALSNLRLLPPLDNMRKGARRKFLL